MDWADGSCWYTQVDWKSGHSATLSTLIIMHRVYVGVQGLKLCIYSDV